MGFMDVNAKVEMEGRPVGVMVIGVLWAGMDT